VRSRCASRIDVSHVAAPTDGVLFRRLEQSNDSLEVTPFEKNLEVWRQLWHVRERSDIMVQILDARNPLFYR
jgi:hypothetical protein